MGFSIYKSQGSSDHNGKLQSYSVDAGHSTLLAIGDLVTVTGTANADGVAGVDASVTAGAVTGVVAGFMPQFEGENLSDTSLPASTAGTAMVHTDPNLLYVADVTGTALVVADVGLNCDFDDAVATKTGNVAVSNMAIDSATKATTAGLPFRIVGLAENDDGTIDGTKAIVRINDSTEIAGTAGV